MNNIFQQYRRRFKYIDWKKISEPLIQKPNGEFVRLVTGSKGPFVMGAEYFRAMWHDVDESGLDSSGRDRYDEIYGNKSKKKIDGKRL